MKVSRIMLLAVSFVLLQPGFLFAQKHLPALVKALNGPYRSAASIDLGLAIQRYIAKGTLSNLRFAGAGYYNPGRIYHSQNYPSLRRMTVSLKQMYPQSERRFAAQYVQDFEDLKDLWDNGTRELFTSPSVAVQNLFQQEGRRRPGFYVLAVESTPGSLRPLHDILILDFNRHRWVSWRKSLAAATALTPPPAAPKNN